MHFKLEDNKWYVKTFWVMAACIGVRDYFEKRLHIDLFKLDFDAEGN